MELTKLASSIVKKRYCDEGETFDERVGKVAQTTASVEEEPTRWSKVFYEEIDNARFIPSSPIMMSFGKDKPFASACNVLPISDSMISIMDAAMKQALVLKYGGGCIGGDSVLITDDGPACIKDFCEDESHSNVLSRKGESTSFCKVEQHHITEVDEYIEINFATGSIEASPWHPFFVWSGEEVIQKRADEIMEGDAIIGSSAWKGDIPEELDQKAWTDGFITADGGFDDSTNGPRLRICKSYKNMIVDAADGLDRKWHKLYRDSLMVDMWEVGVVGKDAKAIAERHNGSAESINCYNKSIPSYIWKAPLREQLSYLVGLFDGDGCVLKGKDLLSYATASKKLMGDLEALLGLLGMRFKTRTRDPRRENETTIYETIIKRSPWVTKLFNSLSKRHALTFGWGHGVIPFSHKFRRELGNLGYPVNNTQFHKEGINIKGFQISTQKWAWSKRLPINSAVLVLEELGYKELAGCLHSAEIVKSVDKHKDHRVLYDLTVPESQTYIAGERSFVVAHNTGMSFGNLRSRGVGVASTGGTASGPCSFLDIFAAVSRSVEQGGRRRGANMAVLPSDHPDILEFATLKTDKPHTDYLAEFNLSVGIYDEFMNHLQEGMSTPLYDPEKGDVGYESAQKIWDSIVDAAWRSGDPGLFFLDTVNRNSLIEESIEAPNPCVTGDTLVAVADGRNAVSIHQLAEEGESIPVHCVDPCSRTAYVKWSDPPRKTRENVDIYKVTFDDGSHIRVTKDHKFLSFEGDEVKTKDLQVNQRLLSFAKYEAENTSTGGRYWKVLDRGEGKPARNEHQMILSAYTDQPSEDHFPHHIDGDGLNNDPDNLRWMTRGEHNKAHPEITDVAGENNPMFGKHHTEETKRQNADRVRGLFKDPEFRKKHSEAVKVAMQDVKYKLEGERVDRITVQCDHCGEDIKLTPGQLNWKKGQDNIFCSTTCQGKFQRGKPMNVRYSEQDAYNLGLRFVEEFNKLPTVKKWSDWSKTQDDCMSREWIRRHMGFPEFKRKLDELRKENHKVKKVEYIGKDDVYNLGVAPYHTVAYITDMDGETRILKSKCLRGVYTCQCGEEPMPSHGSCILGHLNLSKFYDGDSFHWDEYEESIRIGTRFLDNAIDVTEYPIPELREKADQYRLLGVGYMGLAETLAIMGYPYDSSDGRKQAAEFAKVLSEVSIDESEKLAVEKGAIEGYSRRNAWTTTIAPTGTCSLVANTTQGPEPPFALKYKRKVSGIGDITVISPQAIALGLSDSDIKSNGQAKFGDPLLKTATEIDPVDHVKMVAAIQEHIHAGISKSVNLKRDATREDISDIYKLAWELDCKGITIFREGSIEGALTTGDGMKDRDNSLPGMTTKFKTGCGTLYCTVNRDDSGELFEVFTNHGKGGGCPAEAEAMARLTSLALREGVESEAIIDQLSGIKCLSCVARGTDIASCPDALARSLKSKDAAKAEPVASVATCPECGTEKINGRCGVCPECGASGCD